MTKTTETKEAKSTKIGSIKPDDSKKPEPQAEFKTIEKPESQAGKNEPEVKIEGDIQQKPSLYHKINKIMDAIQYLKNDGNINFGSTKYKYLSSEKITQEIRSACAKYGVVILPVDMQVVNMGKITQIVAKYKIVDSDTGEFEIVSSVGQGADSQDKGASKAMTGAFKYMQRQSFMVPSGNDPDKISSPELDADPEFAEITKQQTTEIGKLIKTLGWDRTQAKHFAEATVGSGDISSYTQALADDLIKALKNATKTA